MLHPVVFLTPPIMDLSLVSSTFAHIYFYLDKQVQELKRRCVYEGEHMVHLVLSLGPLT